MTRARSPLMFFALVFALSIPIWLVEPEQWPITAAVGTPLLAGLVLAYIENGPNGVRNLLGRVFDCRRIKHRIWYLPALLLMPFLSLVSYAVMRVAGLSLHAEPSNLLVAIPAFFVLFFVMAIGEEVGWTGYATGPLVERCGPLTTAAILGLVTALWHVAPLVNMGRTPGWIAWWALWSAPQRVFFVWLYTKSGRSVFAALLLHASVNLSVSSPFLRVTAAGWTLRWPGWSPRSRRLWSGCWRSLLRRDQRERDTVGMLSVLAGQRHPDKVFGRA